MKILYYISDYFPITSGTSVQLYNTIRSFPENISCCGIVTPQINAAARGSENIISIPHLKLPFISNDQCYSAASLTSFKRLYNIVRSHKPDILHVIINIHIDPGIYYLIIICRMLKIRLIFSYHTHLEKYFPYMFKAGMVFFSKLTLHISLRLLYFFYDKPALVPSGYTQKYFSSLGMHKTEIWDPCVDREIFNNSGKEKYIYNGDNAKKRLIFVGRLEAEKNIIKLAELFKMLYANDNSFSLTVCGRGGLSALLENIKGITCLGEIDNEKLPQAYKSHDAFVTCSDTETLGNTTIEAMACGLVVVAANAGGTKNIIKDNYNGLLFDAGLLENARNVIVDIFKNPDKMNEISANALLSVEKYNADNSVKKLIGMYSMCLSKFNE